MQYNLVNANIDDLAYLKQAKEYNIFHYANNLTYKEKTRINNYIDKHIPLEMKNYKLIYIKNHIIGCLLVTNKDDGVIIDNIYIEEKYRGFGIGSDIIKKIVTNNRVVYLWVYKENVKAISLYKRLGFKIVLEIDLRYYMKCCLIA